MARKITTRKTAEQRREEAQQLHDRIAAQVDELRSSQAWTDFLTFASNFHAYSLNNLMLIWAQREDATQVAGFRKWQEMGRQVRKGEKSIKILGFAEKKLTEEEAEAAKEAGAIVRRNAKGEPVRIYFPTLSVFDIDQTDKTDPDAPEPADARTFVSRLSGEDEHGIIEAVAAWLESQEWTFTREAIPGETNGYTMTDGSRRVAVDADLSPAQAAKTAIHEAAHVILHSEDAESERAAHRGVRECEAESVAYVVAGMLGLDTSSYSVGYVATWTADDAEAIRSTAANVLRAVHVLADGLMVEEAAAAA
ncbi:ArdC-like ssDNA-binding domain-containing protein [uncultured Brachybacterium sp.]|uniref:ArdC-like ssDNA-binding domain-containing protein n=1 Tax=uncultured Brachybacterium sp. TaxID=189680 RepID=UPI00262E7FB1|nr:ArdC-like ssDNA-binding domain-containing protein [uncultured Brachybacterium sp.]